jgi:hypothetical protein
LAYGGLIFMVAFGVIAVAIVVVVRGSAYRASVRLTQRSG